MVVKLLANKSHLSAEYWAMAYMHCVDLHNILPDRDSGISPFERYHGIAPDLHFSPILPFGSVVMAHIPLQLQTALSGRSIETIYIGRAPLHRDAILVFNPKTKRVLVRHSFKFLSEDEPVSTTYVFGCPIGDVAAPHINEDAANNSLSDDTFAPVLASKCASRYKFAFDYLQQSFTETSSKIRYRIDDVTAEIENAYCFQYYDADKFDRPPVDTSDYEYESIEDVVNV
jgi:hypothetical protein